MPEEMKAKGCDRMKKLFVFFLIAITLTGCTGINQTSDYEHAPEYTVERIGGDTNITMYRDSRTGVYYLARYHGGVCVMVDKDGKPYTD